VNGDNNLIRTAVVAGSLPSRAGLKAILEMDLGIDVVAEAASVADLAKVSVAVIVVMAFSDETLNWDINLSQSTDLPAVLLLSDSAEQIKSLADLPLTGWGVLPIDFTESELIAALYAVDTGLITLSPDHFELLSSQPTPGSKPASEIPINLTARELEVLALLSDGLANKQISLELEISAHTVKFHISSIYQKLNVSNRAEAVRLGIQLGLIMV
jgi:DNA-binding NarL/FixJ family response regulator